MPPTAAAVNGTAKPWMPASMRSELMVVVGDDSGRELRGQPGQGRGGGE